MIPSDAYIVLGGGMGGLVAGLLLKRRNVRATVAILEGSGTLGGAMRGCSRMGEVFDLGTHIPQETGIPEVDSLIEESFNDEQLSRLPSSVGDLAGTLNGTSIRLDTPYLDLLHADPETAQSVVRHVACQAECAESDERRDSRSAHAAIVAEDWFGRTAADSFVMPLVNRLFGESKALSGFALELANLTRVRAADVETWSKHSHSPWFRARIAFPDQRKLPEKFRHTRRSLYPRHGGSEMFIEGLIRQCAAEGVIIETHCRVERVDLGQRLIYVASGAGTRTIGFTRLVSTLGPLITDKLLGGDCPQGAKRVEYRLVHHLLNKGVRLEGCYFYDHGHHSPIYRVTNYQAFSGRTDDRRLTTEILGNDEVADDQLAQEVEHRLLDVGLVEEGGFGRRVVDRQSGGFPLPTVDTFENFRESARKIAEIENGRFVVGGVGSAGIVFFQNEVIRDLHRRLDLLG